jgi:hypothetical protein
MEYPVVEAVAAFDEVLQPEFPGDLVFGKLIVAAFLYRLRERSDPVRILCEHFYHRGAFIFIQMPLGHVPQSATDLGRHFRYLPPAYFIAKLPEETSQDTKNVLLIHATALLLRPCPF